MALALTAQARAPSAFHEPPADPGAATPTAGANKPDTSAAAAPRTRPTPWPQPFAAVDQDVASESPRSPATSLPKRLDPAEIATSTLPSRVDAALDPAPTVGPTAADAAAGAPHHSDVAVVPLPTPVASSLPTEPTLAAPPGLAGATPADPATPPSFGPVSDGPDPLTSEPPTFGAPINVDPPVASTTVPEPTGLSLVAAAAARLLLGRRRRRRRPGESGVTAAT